MKKLLMTVMMAVALMSSTFAAKYDYDNPPSNDKIWSYDLTFNDEEGTIHYKLNEFETTGIRANDNDKIKRFCIGGKVKYFLIDNEVFYGIKYTHYYCKSFPVNIENENKIDVFIDYENKILTVYFGELKSLMFLEFDKVDIVNGHSLRDGRKVEEIKDAELRYHRR